MHGADRVTAFPTIDSTDPRPIYQQIVDSFRRSVVSGRLRPGDQMPSIRELAIDLRVNPNTVQHAYSVMEREGLVQVRRGMGSFIAPNAAVAVGAAVRSAIAREAVRAAAGVGLSIGDLIAELEGLADGPDRHTIESRNVA
ncbi:MAG: GntR family transcriptional regulator [Gemmatimonadales bacterium]|nr:GntR family transcriptional regulator [Gemmatimonadales bacterium]